MLSCSFQTKVLEWAKVTTSAAEEGADLNDGNAFIYVIQNSLMTILRG